MTSTSRKKVCRITCTSHEEIKIAVKAIGSFPVVLGVGPLIAGVHSKSYFVHRDSEIEEQARRALDASNSSSLAASTRGRVTVKKLLDD